MQHLVTLRIALTVLVVSLCGAFSAPAHAGDLTANDIIEKMLKQGMIGADEAESTVRMRLRNSPDDAGTVKMMEIIQRHKEGRLETVTRFRSPPEVAGVAVLVVQREKGDAKQYIYLPGTGKVRPVTRQSRDDNFQGSDFTNADMEGRDTRESEHKRLGDEDIGGEKMFLIESTPKKDSGSAYSKIETWVRQDNFLPQRIRFYDKSGKLLKTLGTVRISKIEGKPVIMETKMVNKQTGHTTELVVDSFKPAKNLPDSAFTPTALEHG